MSIRDSIVGVLENYLPSTQMKFGRGAPVWVKMEELHQEVEKAASAFEYPTLLVVWRAGIGRWASVPWVALLDTEETTTTQSGFYCVFLFRKDMSGVYLTLNQGVTAPGEGNANTLGVAQLRAKASQLRQRCGGLERDGFALDDGIDLRGTHPRVKAYEAATVAYKLYEAGSLPSDEDIARDLGSLLRCYRALVATDKSKASQSPQPDRVAAIGRNEQRQVKPEDFSVAVGRFSEAIEASGLSFGDRQASVLQAFVAAIAAKPFVILSGLSGSGKSQLALKFGQWLGPGKSLIVPVRPDWTGPEAVFGFQDSLSRMPDGRMTWYMTEILEFLLKAAQDPSRPYALILDEMNLAHVERYFADVLSGMESQQPVVPNARPVSDGRWVIPPEGPGRIPLPANLIILGTVNIDETTYLFSPKVLDRASVFEFRVETESLGAVSGRPGPIQSANDLEIDSLMGALTSADWGERWPAPWMETLGDGLKDLHQLLGEANLEFGHRAYQEACRFAALYFAAGEADFHRVLDRIILQKLLPRIHGSRKRVESALCALGEFCFQGEYQEGSAVPGGRIQFDPAAQLSGAAQFPDSFDKVRRMTIALRANQFVSFTE